MLMRMTCRIRSEILNRIRQTHRTETKFWLVRLEVQLFNKFIQNFGFRFSNLLVRFSKKKIVTQILDRTKRINQNFELKIIKLITLTEII